MSDHVKHLIKSELVKDENIHNLELFILKYWYKAVNEYSEIDPTFINRVDYLLEDYLNKSPSIFLLFNKLLMSNYKIMFEKEVDLDYLLDKIFGIRKTGYISNKKYGLRAASLHVNQCIECFVNVFDPIEFYKTFVELCNSKFKDLQPIIVHRNWSYGLNLLIRIIGDKLHRFLFCNDLPDILKISYIYKIGMLLYNNFCKKYYSYLRRQKSEEEKKYFKYFQQLMILLCMKSIGLVLNLLSLFCKRIEDKNHKYKKYKIACKAVDLLEHFLHKFLKYKPFLIEPFDVIVYNNPPHAFTSFCLQFTQPVFIFSNFISWSISTADFNRCFIFDCQPDKKYHHSYCKKLRHLYKTSKQMCQKIYDKLRKGN
jgi:hypothetical protein